MTFEQYFQQCLSMAKSEKQRTIMHKLRSLYEDYYISGMTPSEAMLSEWGGL